MENFIYLALGPWIVFVVFALVAKVLINLAKKRRGLAIAFGVFVQMFSPDPFVERTIKTVVIEKRQECKQREGEKLCKKKK
jgi:hypothetical protein